MATVVAASLLIGGGGYVLIGTPAPVIQPTPPVAAPQPASRNPQEWATEAQVVLASINRQLDEISQTEEKWLRLPEQRRRGDPPPAVASMLHRKATLEQQRATLQSQLAMVRSLPDISTDLTTIDAELNSLGRVLATADPSAPAPGGAVTHLAEQRDIWLEQRQHKAEELERLQTGIQVAVASALPQPTGQLAPLIDQVLALVAGDPPARRSPTLEEHTLPVAALQRREATDDRPRGDSATTSPPDPAPGLDEILAGPSESSEDAVPDDAAPSDASDSYADPGTWLAVDRPGRQEQPETVGVGSEDEHATDSSDRDGFDGQDVVEGLVGRTVGSVARLVRAEPDQEAHGSRGAAEQEEPAEETEAPVDRVSTARATTPPTALPTTLRGWLERGTSGEGSASSPTGLDEQAESSPQTAASALTDPAPTGPDRAAAQRSQPTPEASREQVAAPGPGTVQNGLDADHRHPAASPDVVAAERAHDSAPKPVAQTPADVVRPREAAAATTPPTGPQAPSSKAEGSTPPPTATSARPVTERTTPDTTPALRADAPTTDTAGKPRPVDRQGAQKPVATADTHPQNTKPSVAKPSGAKPGDGKPGEAKPSDAKPADGKPAGGKPGEAKPSDAKPAGGKPGEAKPSGAKPSDAKPSEGKPSDSKPSDSKPSDSKPSDSKPSDSKPRDTKPRDTKPSHAKPGP